MKSILLISFLFYFLNAENSCGENCEWSISDSTLTISGTGDMDNFYNPRNIPWGNKKADITKIVISDGITSIGKRSFEGFEAVKEVTFGKDVETIGMGAFYKCKSLESITFGDNLMLIEERAFEYCRNLNKIVFSSDTKKKLRIERKSFKNCESLEVLNLSDKVETIGDKAFLDCKKLENVTIGSNVNKIGQNVFSGCKSLQRIEVSERNRGYKSVNEVLLTNGEVIYYPLQRESKEYTVESRIIGKESFEETNVEKIEFSKMTSEIRESAFYGNTNIQRLDFRATMKKVGTTAFARSKSLEIVYIYSSETKFESDVFLGCEKIKEIYYLDTTNQMQCDETTFSKTNENLKIKVQREYGGSVTEMCGKPVSASLVTETDKNGNGYLFDDETKRLYIYGEGTIERKEKWDTIKDSVETIEIEKGYTEIGDNAFEGFSQITNFEIPETITSIGDGAFSNMENLEEIIIPPSVTEIGDEVFSGSDKLVTIEYTGTRTPYCRKEGLDGSSVEIIKVPENYNGDKLCEQSVSKWYGKCGDKCTWGIIDEYKLEIVGEGTMYDYARYDNDPGWFEHRNDLTLIEIRKGITYIGSYAFFDIPMLEKIIIPSTVEELGPSFLLVCPELLIVDFPEGNSNFLIADGVLYDPTKTELILYPSGLTMNSFEVKATVTNIRENAFTYCKHIQKFQIETGNTKFTVLNGILYNEDQTYLIYYPLANTDETHTISDTTTTIASYAFYGTSYLKEITVMDIVENIGDGAFGGSSKLNLVSYIGTKNPTENIDKINLFYRSDLITTVYVPKNYEGTKFGEKDVTNTLMAGRCGKHIIWKVDFNGLMTMIGYGDMFDYTTSETTRPWDYCTDKFTTVLFGDGITTLGEYAFYNNQNIKSMGFANTVTEIGKGFCEGCSAMDKLFLSKEIKTIGDKAFYGNTKLNVTFLAPKEPTCSTTVFDTTVPVMVRADFEETTPDNTLCGAPMDTEKAKSQQCTSSADNGAIGSTTYYMFDEIKGEFLLYGTGSTSQKYTRYSPTHPWTNLYENVTTVVIDGIERIGQYTFANFHKLEHVIIGPSVKQIDTGAFEECFSIKSIYFPATVLSLGDYMFGLCLSLTNIEVDPENPNYSSSEGMLFNKAKTRLIQYPAGKSAETYEIPQHVTAFGNHCFYGSTLLKSLKIHKGVTSIGTNPFIHCHSLERIEVDPENPNYASVDGVLFNKGITTMIGYPCGNKRKYYFIPQTVRTLGGQTMRGSKIIETLIIPDGLINLPSHLLSYADNFKTIIYESTTTGTISTIFAEYDYYWEPGVIPVQVLARHDYVGAAVKLHVAPITKVHESPLIAGLFELFYEPIGYVFVYGSGAIPENEYKNNQSIEITKYNEGVSEIGKSAFDNCLNLREIVFIGSTVKTIKSKAFENCRALPSFNGTATITLFEDEPMGNCSKMTTINIPSGNTKYQSVDGVLIDKVNNAIIQYPAGKKGNNYDIPSTVVTIKRYSFFGTLDLKFVTIHSGVTNIYYNPFIEVYNLQEIRVDEGNTKYCDIDEVLYTEDKKTLISFPDSHRYYYYIMPQSTITIDNQAFRGNQNTSVVVIPSTVTAINELSFSYCMVLNTINYEGDLTGVSENIFYDDGNFAIPMIYVRHNSRTTKFGGQDVYDLYYDECGTNTYYYSDYELNYLYIYGSGSTKDYSDNPDKGDRTPWILSGLSYRYRTVKVDEGVTRIGHYLFEGLESIDTIVLPKTLTTFGKGCFQSSYSITTFTIPSTITTIEGYPFASCGNLQTIFVEATGGKYTSQDGVLIESGTKIVQYPPGSVEETYTIPNGITQLGENSFKGSISLTEIKIGKDVTTIQGNPFVSCDYLVNVVIDSENSKYILHEGVIYNKQMTEIVSYLSSKEDDLYIIPTTVTKIGKQSIYGNDYIYNIIIPSSVTSIEENGIYNLYNLDTVTYEGKTLMEGEFLTASSALIYLRHDYPDSVFGESNPFRMIKEDIPLKCGDSTFYMEVTDNFQFYYLFVYGTGEIDPNEYQNAPWKTSEGVYDVLKIDKGITKISKYNFASMSSVKDIYIGDDVKMIDDFAFEGCNGIESITIPKGVTNMGENPFGKCQRLNEIKVEGTNYKFENGVLYQTSTGKLITYLHTKTGTMYTIPSSITKLGGSAFKGNTQITKITLNTAINEFDGNPFLEMPQLTSIDLNGNTNFKIEGNKLYKSDYSILYYSIADDESDIIFTLKSNLQEIRKGSLKNNKKIKHVTIPGTIKRIDDEAFAETSNLEEVVYFGEKEPATCSQTAFGKARPTEWIIVFSNYTANEFCGQKVKKEIQDYGYVEGTDVAWYLTTSFKLVIYGQGAFLTKPESWEIKYKNKIKSIEIKSEITEIGPKVFEGLSENKQVIIGNPQITIGENPFILNKKLESIIIETGKYEVKGGLLIETQTQKIVAYMTGKAEKTITIPDGIIIIGKSSFIDNYDLKTLTIPSSVTTIETNAFVRCTVLSSVTYMGSIDSLTCEDNTFNDSILESIEVPEANYQEEKTLCGEMVTMIGGEVEPQE